MGGIGVCCASTGEANANVAAVIKINFIILSLYVLSVGWNPAERAQNSKQIAHFGANSQLKLL